MTVTQRSREIALLRAIGATPAPGDAQPAARGPAAGRRSPRRSGSALGIGVAKGLKSLMDAVGLALPFTSLQIEASTDLDLARWSAPASPSWPPWSRLAGPPRCCRSRRCASPTPGAEKPSKRRALIGLVVLAGRRGGAAVGAVRRRRHEALRARSARGHGRRDRRAAGRGASAGRRRSRAPLRLRGLPGELAKQNATRNPRRTSATAAALMIGLTLVVSMGVFASSLKASFGDVLVGPDERGPVRRHLQRPGAGLQPVGRSTRSADVDGVDEVSASGWGMARFDGADSELLRDRPRQRRGGPEPRRVRRARWPTSARTGSMVAESAATEHGWKLGDTVTGGVRRERQAPAAHRRRSTTGKGWIGDDYVVSRGRAEGASPVRSWCPAPS